ncbi:hypothetical protein EDB89DRAFT_1903314 [Lactarius sanguifluus]|nr:hypothetical protein EDB89DRAFT_1903314 [Lactarius sanguifluus]
MAAVRFCLATSCPFKGRYSRGACAWDYGFNVLLNMMPAHSCLFHTSVLARSARVIHGVWVVPPVAFICTLCPFRCSVMRDVVGVILFDEYRVRFSHAVSNFPTRFSCLASSRWLSGIICTIGHAFYDTNANVIQFVLDAHVIGSTLCQLRSTLDIFEG